MSEAKRRRTAQTTESGGGGKRPPTLEEWAEYVASCARIGISYEMGPIRDPRIIRALDTGDFSDPQVQLAMMNDWIASLARLAILKEIIAGEDLPFDPIWASMGITAPRSIWQDIARGRVPARCTGQLKFEIPLEVLREWERRHNTRSH